MLPNDCVTPLPSDVGTATYISIQCDQCDRWVAPGLPGVTVGNCRGETIISLSLCEQGYREGGEADGSLLASMCESKREESE